MEVPIIYVTVQTREDIAQDLVKDQPELPDTKKLRAVLSELGLYVQPLHPGTEDPELSTQFFVSVPNEELAVEVSRRLRESKVIEAAYVKRPGAPPSQ